MAGSVRSVTDLVVKDGQVTYLSAGRQDTIPLDDIAFSINVSTEDHPRHIICALHEDAENAERPFSLTLLEAQSRPHEVQHSTRGLPAHLTPSANNAVDFIISTKSGTGKALAFWETVLRPLLLVLEAPNPSATITEDAQSVRRFATSLSPTPSRTIVLLSGDGGIVDLLNNYQKPAASNPPLVALVPLGTGNALFHSSHKGIGPSPLVGALRSLFLGTPSDLPMFRASFSAGSHIVAGDETTPVSSLYGAIVASFGFHASIVYESDTPAYRVHGDKRFGMVAQELLRESHPYKAALRVRAPGEAALRPLGGPTHGYILAAMVSNLEKTFTISPAGRPLDGKLHLVHFGPVGGERTMEAMMAAYDGGKHVDLRWGDEAVTYTELEEMNVSTNDEDRWRKFCIDGTIVHVPSGGSMTVSKADAPLLKIMVCR